MPDISAISGVAASIIAKRTGKTKAQIAKLSSKGNPGNRFPTLFLDTYTGAVAAYSFRELNSSYTGNCVRVQNNSGTNLDVGFVSGYLDTASIATHCGTGDGKIVTWYDQSGNGNDITQSSTSAMPRLFINGTIRSTNSQVLAYFDGNDNLKTSSVSLHSGAWYCASSCIPSNNSANMQLWSQDDSFTSTRVRIAQYLRIRGSSRKMRSIMFNTARQNFQSEASPTLAASTHALFSAYTDTSNTEIKAFLDSTNTNSATSYSGTPATTAHEIAMGCNPHGQSDRVFWTGDIQELIMWDSSRTSDRSTIESEINTYYSIT